MLGKQEFDFGKEIHFSLPLFLRKPLILYEFHDKIT